MNVLTEPAAETAIKYAENSSQEISTGSSQHTTQSVQDQSADKDKSQEEDSSQSNMDESVEEECVSEVNRIDESEPKTSEIRHSDKIVTEEIAEKQDVQVGEQVTVSVSTEQLPEKSASKSLDDVSKEVVEPAIADEDAMEVSEPGESDIPTKIPEIENATAKDGIVNQERMEDVPILLAESEAKDAGFKDIEKMDLDNPVENITSPKETITAPDPEPEIIRNDDDPEIKDSITEETEITEKEVELVEDAADESGAPINDNLSDADDQEMQQENPVFVHVSSKGDGESESDKNSNADLQNETGDESLEATSLVEEDPIGISQEPEKDVLDLSEDGSEKEPTIKVVNFSEAITSDKNLIDEELVASKGADEELCIIPDTEREITQEEKDAARAAAAKAASAEVPRLTVLDHGQTESSTSPDSDKPAEKSADTINKDSSTDTDGVVVLSDSAESTDVTTKKAPSVKLTHIPKPIQTEDTCNECNSVRKIQFSAFDNNTELKLCSQVCVSAFVKKKSVSEKETLKVAEVRKTITRSEKTFVRKCSECQTHILDGDEKVLCWETMDFCHEDCLSKYQNVIGSHCANCKNAVVMSSLGKYCVRFGHDIRQFCCSTCLEEFKKGLKVCSYCQRDISAGQEGFLAPVGDKGQFKDFCGPSCMEKYEYMSNKNSVKSAPSERALCAVCNQENVINLLFDEFETKHKFCSEPCFIAFKYVNNVDPPKCEMCSNYFENEDCTMFSIFYENMIKHFCTKTCQNIYIIANRRIVPCSWCKVKKYNFDMIKKNCNNGQTLMMCSINCLSLFQVSINAVSTKKSKCDHCSKLMHAQYHLTMSDATIRNFCTYQCVMAFQNQFGKIPIALNSPDQPVTITRTPSSVVPTSGPKRYTRASRSSTVETTASEVQMPVITSVQSLAAPVTNGPTPTTLTRSAALKINNQQQPIPTVAQIPPPKPVVKQQVIIKPPPMPPMKNAVTMCKPIMHTKGISCRPHSCSKETQTDVIKEKTVLVPVPVPIYVPAPCQMYSAPLPVPIPFPIPIPVPIFIPTTRNSSAGIMKEIKKIQVKIPTDPFEAELLMMAEMVAGEKKVENTDSESEEDDAAGNCSDTGNDGGFSPEAVDTSNTFGDDMLQMALKMATELDEPAVDLEGALTANTITASQNPDPTGGVVQTEEAVDDPQQPMHPMMDRQAIRGGRKRPARSPRSLVPGAKRGRRLSTHVEMPLLPPPAPSQPPEPIEKPDANMCLKYTFGVNAWKQWVTTKNTELEKSSRRVKLFKNEILQLTADELNYSLCLFVKEVRKPNGTEYAPDTIYYLCLGIQQYLFENGRIDNIFTDTYYEKFTDCLDEVARKFSVLYNDSHYIVTRVEEEHLWESKQLGAHSPHVLLSTLMFFNTKHFNLTTVDEHMQLSFSHIMKHWKRNPNTPGAAKIPGSRNVLLRFYPPQTTLDANSRKKKVYEQQENEDNPLRCPVKLYEFYLSKCPESVKTRNDVFYLLPERSCVPDSPVWYSTMALGREALEKMLHRVKMVKEINIALLTMD